MTGPGPWDDAVQAALEATAEYYDARKVGDVGALGFRRSTRLGALLEFLPDLVRRGYLVPGQTNFLDMGCADGRVNVFMSYLVGQSIGVEIDEWTLDDYAPLRAGLVETLEKKNLPKPPENCTLLRGDTLGEEIRESIDRQAGVPLKEMDIFFTYLTLHQEFAGLVAQEARSGAVFIVYGLDLILPRLDGLELMRDQSPRHLKLAVYRKP